MRHLLAVLVCSLFLSACGESTLLGVDPKKYCPDDEKFDDRCDNANRDNYDN